MAIETASLTGKSGAVRVDVTYDTVTFDLTVRLRGFASHPDMEFVLDRTDPNDPARSIRGVWSGLASDDETVETVVPSVEGDPYTMQLQSVPA